MIKSFKKFKLRLLSEEKILVPEVKQALRDWIASTKDTGILIGGLAYSLYAKPRETTDIDVIYISDDQIPNEVKGFKKTRTHSFLHLKTHVEVEVLSPKFLNIPQDLFNKVAETSELSSDGYGVKTASPNGIAALKLFRGELKDLGDIEGLIKAGYNINLTDWPIPKICWDKVESILDKYNLKLKK